MNDAPWQRPADDDPPPETLAFYRRVLQILSDARLPFLVGGAYALNRYAATSRRTKDLDIFIRRDDVERAGTSLQHCGYRTDLVYPHWLAKAYDDSKESDDNFVDIIFSSGNGVAEVDDLWFEHAADDIVFGIEAKLCPAEEMIWSKAFVMERERFDGADVAHLLHARADYIDWERLMSRFGPHWRVLFCHLVLFGFAYPGHRDLIPRRIMNALVDRLHEETNASHDADDDICAGTLLSREQYLMDIEHFGYRDARVVPLGKMTTKDTARWTDAIGKQSGPH